MRKIRIGTYIFFGVMLFRILFQLLVPVQAQEAEVLTQKLVYERIMAQKENYPEGTSWTINDRYTLSVKLDGKKVSSGGCTAFAYLLSDVGFGTGKYEARTYYEYDNIRVGDIIRIANNTHSVVVLDISGDIVTIVEGNYTKSVHWGRKLSLTELKNGGITYGITRYPEDYSEESTEESTEGSTEETPEESTEKLPENETEEPTVDGTETPEEEQNSENTEESTEESDEETTEDTTETGPEFGWLNLEGKSYWYEGAVRQGTCNDPQGVLGDGSVRGREIYDAGSDGWYWLDAVYDGAKAVNKEVWVPYIYQNEADWGEEEIRNNANASGNMAEQVIREINNKSGKWVRYDANGKMYKGWYTVEGADAEIYPEQVGNTYYYDYKTGLMAKGWVEIDGASYYFDEVTGILQ